MLNASTLRAALKDIYGVEDRYLVPLSKGWYVPTYDKNDLVGTWIGYRVSSKQPYARGYSQNETTWIRPIKTSFRVSFVGPQAEDLADQTLLWDERTDVQEAFEKHCLAQLNYNARQMFSYPVKEGGLNDGLCWCVDFSAQTFYTTTVKREPWGYVIEPYGDIKIQGDV